MRSGNLLAGALRRSAAAASSRQHGRPFAFAASVPSLTRRRALSTVPITFVEEGEEIKVDAEIGKTLLFAAENPVINGSVINANLGQIER